jgi:hypothetical protein
VKTPAVITLTSAGRDPRRIVTYTPGDVARNACFTQDLDAPLGNATDDGNVFDNSVVLCASWKGAAGTYAFKNTRAYIGGAHIGEDNMSEGEKKVVDGIESVIMKAPPGTASTDKQGRIDAVQGGMPTEPSAPILLWTFSVPFPAESIGIGATWKVQDATPTGHASSLDYTLVSLDDRGATVHWKGALTADALSIPVEGEATLLFTDVLAQSGWETMELALDPTGKTPPAHTRLVLADSKP